MDVLSRPAEEFENDQTVEALWAMKAYEHAEVYFNILCSVDPKLLRLTPEDDLIYKLFREEFPNLDIKVIRESELKSPKEKAKWRPFCEKFKNIVEDYSYGTLIRADATKDYSEENTILVTRIQFYAIEIARNREGVNDDLRRLFKPTRDEADQKNNKTSVS
ncbi:protein PBDC1 [Anthonomus grandis grandis]|uniref:protein PBDC1 n=1 Tax=Anthonomus grandis grandis TaxID=2921223 RepID=UPI00216688FE|nr:protein PBDC1 [Anthonomus grandis grandis]